MAWLKKIQIIMISAISLALTLAMYVLGVGIVSLIGRLLGKEFLMVKTGESAWVKFLPSRSRKRMY